MINISQSQRDYWSLRIWRDTAAITLLIAAPILQIIFPRWLPFAVLLTLLFVAIGHLATGFRHIQLNQLTQALDFKKWSKAARWLALSYISFLAWMTVSLLWSPSASVGLIDTVILAVSPAICFIIASEIKKVIVVPFQTLLIVGLTATSAALTLELISLTSFFKLYLKHPSIHDLNRNIVFLFLCSLVLLETKNNSKIENILLILTSILLATSIYNSPSEAVKLMLIAAGLAWVILRLFPSLYTLMFVGIAAITIIFPLLITPVDRFFEAWKGTPISPKAATERIVIWQEYKDAIIEQPITGFGARAHRWLASSENTIPEISPSNYPHNLSVEVWTDLGAIGILCFCLTIISLGIATRSQNRKNLATAGAIVAASYSYSMTAASFLQGWWIASIGITFIALITLRATQQQTPGDT